MANDSQKVALVPDLVNGHTLNPTDSAVRDSRVMGVLKTLVNKAGVFWINPETGGYSKLAELTGFTVRQVRNSLRDLVLTKSLARVSFHPSKPSRLVQPQNPGNQEPLSYSRKALTLYSGVIHTIPGALGYRRHFITGYSISVTHTRRPHRRRLHNLNHRTVVIDIDTAQTLALRMKPEEVAAVIRFAKPRLLWIEVQREYWNIRNEFKRTDKLPVWYLDACVQYRTDRIEYRSGLIANRFHPERRAV